MAKRLVLCVAAALIVAGCATTGKGPTDEELINSTLQKVKTALESQNLDMLMETFAEDFSHDQVPDKATAREMLDMGISMGYADDGECNLDRVSVSIDPDGETASAYPVDLSGPPGSISVELILGKREIEVDGKKQKAWLITTINPDGM